MIDLRQVRASAGALGLAVSLACAGLSLAVSGSPAQAQSSPRIMGQAAAQDSEVIVNQVDSARYPTVNAFVTVLRNGQPVKGLAAADFRVREDEVDQGPLRVEPRLTPLYAVVTLDTSGSMRQRLSEAKDAALAFIDGLAPEDRVRVLSFAREVRILNGAGADRTSAKAGVSATIARGDTALYDALYASIELTKEQPGRKAVVLLSDGVDDDGTGRQLSKRSLSEALDLARSVNVPVYAIGLGTEIDDGILRRVAEETGGQYYKAPEASQLRALYARIGEQLAGQYSISYESNLPQDGSERRLAVTAAGVTGTKVFRPAQGAAPAPVSSLKPAVVSEDGRVTGGESFETAALIEPGRTYRLQDHLPKGDVAYFAFDAQGGQQITASIRTGTKGVSEFGNTLRETDFPPFAGMALVSPEREMIGQRVDIINGPLKKETLQVRLGAGQDGRYYFLVGSRHGPQHRDTEFMVEVTGQARPSAPQRTGPSTTSALHVPPGGRVLGGRSFEAAAPLELGRAYRLEEHLPKGETAYFTVDIPPGKTVAAFVHTGLKGAAEGLNGTFLETDTPSAGIAVASSDRQLVGERQEILNGPLKRAGGRYRLNGGKGGKAYILVGSKWGPQHRDTEFGVVVVDEAANR